MARKQERKFTPFNLEASPVVAENERILNNPTTATEQQVTQPTTDAQQAMAPVQDAAIPYHQGRHRHLLGAKERLLGLSVEAAMLPQCSHSQDCP